MAHRRTLGSLDRQQGRWRTGRSQRIAVRTPFDYQEKLLWGLLWQVPLHRMVPPVPVREVVTLPVQEPFAVVSTSRNPLTCVAVSAPG